MSRPKRKGFVYLDVRLQFREPDKALALYVKKEAARNRRRAREQIMYMLQYAAAQMPIRDPHNDDDDGIAYA